MKFADRQGNLHENKEKKISHKYYSYDNPLRERLENFYAKARKAPKGQSFLQSPISRNLIRLFVNRHEIDMRDYEETTFISFDEFYKRKIKRGKRPVNFKENVLAAPCDGKVMLADIGSDGNFLYKDKIYKIGNQTGNYKLADKFAKGKALIIHLSPEDYHHFLAMDEGKKSANRRIKTSLIAADEKRDGEFHFYKKDYRESFMFRSRHFGDFAFVLSSGAYKGRFICMQEEARVKKGQEMGFFESGNAYIVIFFEKDRLIFDEDLEKNSKMGLPTQVTMGEQIACAKK